MFRKLFTHFTNSSIFRAVLCYFRGVRILVRHSTNMKRTKEDYTKPVDEVLESVRTRVVPINFGYPK